MTVPCLNRRNSWMMTLVAVVLITAGCATSRPPAEQYIDARHHAPHTQVDELDNPFLGVNRSAEVESFFQEYNYQRFGKGLRMGITEPELVRLARIVPQKRYTGEPGEEEFTFTWPREPTGFRVMLREGRVIAWMSERAVFLEPERLGR